MGLTINSPAPPNVYIRKNDVNLDRSVAFPKDDNKFTEGKYFGGERDAFAKAYNSAKSTKSSQFIETAYGSLSDWSGVCEEIDAQLKSYKELFERFRETVYDSQNRSGEKEYACSLLKSINLGLAGVKYQNNTLKKGVNDGGSQEVKELWGLIEKKPQTYFSNNNLYKPDEEKYQAFLKGTAHTSAIDNRLDEILKEILGK
ncbi:MAG: hypothetical protein HFH68_04645 [Lachnospiraceae bacterium]|nr:hypothetical protein [Lachnospiraceae bacterium]